jgi:phosphatidate cytidylyltransferase
LADGAILLAVSIMATWATDTAAYFAGVGMGRHPFFPAISPKKTWEGAIGGVAGAALVFGALMSIYGIQPLVALLGGVGLGIAGTLGDLVESLIKRQSGVKDSGSLIVGHGGVLDRLDSMLFTVTFAYYFFALVKA